MPITFAGVAVLALITAAAAPPASPLPSPPLPMASKPTASVAEVAWIAGHWVDDTGGNLSEEIWAAPAGDSMLGMWRYVAKGRIQISEHLSITDEPGGPVFRLRHFDPRMVAREAKDSPLALKLVSVKDREVAFEGPGQPTGRVRLTYRRPAADVLSVTLEKDGRPQAFQFRRQGP